MKKITAGAVALSALLLLTGCGIDSGTIKDKRHTEGYYYTSTICAGYNSQGICTVYVPVTNYQPDTYAFDLYRSEDEHGWHGVSSGTYDNYQIGDYYQEEK